MTINPRESDYFFWHCKVAATLIDSFPENTATIVHSAKAVRLASDNAVGKRGIRHASDTAMAFKLASGLPWERCGFVREHAVPVSLIHDLVRRELVRTAETAPVLPTFSPLESRRLTKATIAQFQGDPRAWQVGKIVLDWALLAWVTGDDDKRLRGAGLAKRMPVGWIEGQDRFARYTACNIRCIEVVDGAVKTGDDVIAVSCQGAALGV